MRRYTVTLVPGDGIGPEVTAAAVRILSATGIEFDWQTEVAGASAVGEHGTALPPQVLESVRFIRDKQRARRHGLEHAHIDVAVDAGIYDNLRLGVNSRHFMRPTLR